MAAKKTAKTDLKKAAKEQFATKPAGPKFESITGVMVAKARGTLPRGAKFVVHGGRAQFRVESKHTGTTLFDGDASDIARWALKKLGFKVQAAA